MISPVMDPRLIIGEDPLIVNSNELESEVAWAIDVRTDMPGVPPIDHTMLSINTAKFVMQGPGGYQEIPMDDYLINGGQLIFTELVHTNTDFVEAFRQSVLAKLNGPWYRKAYNWLQIAGQAIGMPWLSFPGLDDCSMDVIYHLKAAAPHLPDADNKIIQAISNTVNPEQFMAIQLHTPSVFNVKYSWDSITGVTG